MTLIYITNCADGCLVVSDHRWAYFIPSSKLWVWTRQRPTWSNYKCHNDVEGNFNVKVTGSVPGLSAGSRASARGQDKASILPTSKKVWSAKINQLDRSRTLPKVTKYQIIFRWHIYTLIKMSFLPFLGLSVIFLLHPWHHTNYSGQGAYEDNSRS